MYKFLYICYTTFNIWTICSSDNLQAQIIVFFIWLGTSIILYLIDRYCNDILEDLKKEWKKYLDETSY